MRRTDLAIVILYGVMVTAVLIGQGSPASPVQNPAPLSVHGPLPEGAPVGNQFITGHLYSASINPETKLATWCAYVVTPGQFEGANSIARNWINAQGGLAEKCLEHQDYDDSGYDMGHLVPLASFSSTRWAYECNFVGVIVPQTANLNRGPWLRLENQIRSLAEDHDKVYVCVGTLYESDMTPLKNADEDHVVPSHYWAVIRYADKIEAYIMGQDVERSVASLDQFKSTVEALTLRTGLKF